MLRWMAGVSLSERKSNECVRSMLAIDVAEVMQRNRLRWFGHVERRDELCWIKRIETLQVDGDGVKGRQTQEEIERSVERRDFVGKMFGTGQRGGECCGKVIGEVNPSTLGKTNLVIISGCCFWNFRLRKSDVLPEEYTCISSSNLVIK